MTADELVTELLGWIETMLTTLSADRQTHPIRVSHIAGQLQGLLLVKDWLRMYQEQQ